METAGPQSPTSPEMYPGREVPAHVVPVPKMVSDVMQQIIADPNAHASHKPPVDEQLLSPLVGDLSGFPPSIIITGTRDLFLSLGALTHRKLRRAGVPAELFVFEGASHIQFLFPSPECDEAMKAVSTFFDRHLGA